MPHISVVVAALDACGVSSTVCSLHAQTTTDWDAVLVGPWPATAAHVSAKIVEIDAHPATAAAAFNAGLSSARGEWLLFLEAGQTLLPGALERLLAYVANTPGAQAVFGASYWREPGPPAGLDVRGGPPTSSNWHMRAFPQTLMDAPPSLAATLVRRAAALELRGFDETFVQLFAEQFLTRLSRTGTFARIDAGVTLLTEAPDAAERRAPGVGLDERLRLLDGVLAGDRSGAATPLRIQAYTRASRLYLSNGQHAPAMASFRAATASATDTPSREALVAEVVQAALDFCANDDPHAIAFVRDATAFGPRELKTSTLARLHETLAFAAHRRGATTATLSHAARAVRGSARARANRGLWKTALLSAVGRRPKLRDASAGDALLSRLAMQPSVFISPHFDDAPLSCGGVLSLLSRQKSQVTLLTVCTADAATEADRSPLAQAFRTVWGRPEDPYLVRAEEETAVANALGFQTCWLGFPEAPCRYPRMRSADEVSGRGYEPRADPAFRQVKDALREALRHHPNATLFAPLALDHLDHKLVHAAVAGLMSDGVLRQPVLFYEDFPYAARGNLQHRLNEFAPPLRPLTVYVASALPNKLALIHMYASQFDMLFVSDAAARAEVTDFALQTGEKDGPCERYWFQPFRQ